MRLPVDRSFARIILTVSLGALGLASGAALARGGSERPMPANGPQGDYPVVVGPAYSVAGVTFTPEDVMNYDQVGLIAADGGAGISAAHHTLPLPSYVEVTSLVTGRTILARVERRGPMDTGDLIGLSPAAFAQLDATAGSPVRVRRVNPPEDQRALLRAGGPAPLRMDTPMSLVEVLKRKLPGRNTTSPVAIASAAVSTAASPAKPGPTVARPAAKPEVKSAVPPLPQMASREPAKPKPEAKPSAPAPKATATPTKGKFEVQAAAFASGDNARKAAGKLGAQVTQAGRLFRVRTGPFATRGEAEASLAKVRAAGYSDARIQTSG